MPQPPTNKNFSLNFSLGSAFVGVVVLTSILFALATYPNIRSFVRSGIRERLSDAVSIAALQIDPDLLAKITTSNNEDSDDYKTLQRQLQKIRDHGTDIRFVYTLRKNDRGEYVFIVDAEEKEKDRSHLGEIYADPTQFMEAAFVPPYLVHVEDRFFRDKWGNWLTSYAPILHPDGRLEGVLAIDISAEKVLDYERRYLLILLAVGMGICSFVVFVSLKVSRRICHPLLLLEQDMTRMQRFDISEEIHLKSRITEIINMENAINNMKNGLRSFKKYVPAELVSELITLHKVAALGAEKRQLTVFFCDIRDFSSLSERLSPEVLSQLMGIYFDGMTKIILRHQGTVDKYIGDSIMAFWGAPRPCDNQAVQACLATIECQKFVTELAEKYRTHGLESFATRFGLNTGDAIVGNFGYEERFNYTAMGDSVNVASRLEGLNKEYGTTVLISESTYLQAKHVIEARVLDRVVLKGKSIGVTIFELLGENGSLSDEEKAALAQYNQGMEVFFSGYLGAAREIFTNLCQQYPDDRLAKTMLNRCNNGLA
jgi:class 3 adenylate cyclase